MPSPNMLRILLFTTVFISISTSLVTYNFNQPIQLLRLLKMDPRRQLALIRLSDSTFQRYDPGQVTVNQVNSDQQPQQQLQQPKVSVDLLATAKKWDRDMTAAAVYWPKMLMAYEVKPSSNEQSDGWDE